MKTLLVLVCTLVLLPWTMSADTFSTYEYQFGLSPSAETPAPITDGRASGGGVVRIHVRRSDDGAIVTAAVDFDTSLSVDQAQTLTNMHIHKGALGVPGGVVVDSVFGSPIPVDEGGSVRILRQNVIAGDNATGVATIEDILVNPGGYYVNVHSQTHPGGIARGQLNPSNLTATQAVGAQVTALQADIDALQAQLTAVQTLLTRLALRFSINP